MHGAIPLTIVLSAIIGILLGVLGGGGSTLTVPMLTFVAGLGARGAITTSLVVVGITSVVGAIAHTRAGRVQWRPALLLGLTGMVGAFVGGRFAAHIPIRFTMLVFAAIVVASAVALLRGRAGHTATAEQFDVPVITSVVLGFVVGVVSGLTGAGGGFLLVAALTLVCRMAIPVAVGTSLVVIAMHCFAALAGRLEGEHINWQLAIMVTVAAVCGSLVGERLTTVIQPDGLRRAFGILALIMGIGIIGDELKVWQSVELAQLVCVFVLYTWWRRSQPDHLHPLADSRPWNGPVLGTLTRPPSR